jgi:phosphoribosyl-AMP cyclohydrolase
MTELTQLVESADPTAGLQFNQAGLVCAVVQQFDSKEVLMVAWMDGEALRRTLATGAAT